MASASMDDFVRSVRAQTDILSVVSGYVALKHRSGRYWGCCPFHSEKTASFSVVPNEGFFYCFGCHVGGDVFKFISLIENIDYFQAIKLQAEKLNIPLPRRNPSAAELSREKKLKDLRRLHALACDFFHNCLTLTGYGDPCRKYLAGRGITAETVKEFKLGFAPDAWDKLLSAFKKRGIGEQLLVEASLVSENKNKTGFYDRFRNRLMIPIADEQGRVVAFGGRVLGEGTPKYLNSAETEIFNKRRLLFGLDRAKRPIGAAGYVVIVEGYMDAISLHSAGVKNAVASLGTAFTADHCRLLLRYTTRFYFCYDSDAAGQQATLRALSMVKGTNAKVNVIIVPDGKDPDEFVHKHGVSAFEELIKNALPVTEFQLQYFLKRRKYDRLDGKMAVLGDMMPVLDAMESTTKIETVKRLAQILMLEEGVVQDELRRYAAMPHGTPQASIVRSQPVPAVSRNDKDNALRRAGRIVIKAAWRDASVISYLKATLPPEAFANVAQREILQRLYAPESYTQVNFDKIMAELDETATKELSLALVEQSESGDGYEAYHDSVKTLHRAYLNQAYMEHTRKVEEYIANGNTEAYINELSEIKRIKEEIDELEGD